MKAIPECSPEAHIPDLLSRGTEHTYRNSAGDGRLITHEQMTETRQVSTGRKGTNREGDTMRIRDIRRAEQHEDRIGQTRAQIGDYCPVNETPRPPLHTETVAKLWRMNKGPQPSTGHDSYKPQKPQAKKIYRDNRDVNATIVDYWLQTAQIRSKVLGSGDMPATKEGTTPEGATQPRRPQTHQE